MRHGQNHGLGMLDRGRQVFLHPNVLQSFLVVEEPRPGMARRGIDVLLLQFVPVVDIRIVDAHVGAHFGELAHDHFRTAVAGIAHVLPVAGAANQHVGPGDVAAHVPQGVAGQFGDVQRPGVVDVDGHRADLEDFVAVLEAEDVLVGPIAQAAVLGQAVAADAGAGEDDVAVRRAHLDRLDDLDQIDAVALGEQAPFVQERQDRGPIGVLDDLRRLRLDRPIHDGQRELLGVQYLARNFSTRVRRFGVAAGADPPEIADRRNVFAARHHALETVRRSGSP